jgi:4-amino-4-deoxy-L-arabinose transferase-like glycosyltransferase
MRKSLIFDIGALVRLIKIVLATAAIYYIVAFITTAFLRLAYPYELDWLEGVSLDLVRRVLEGQAIYARPSVEFVPFIYPPLFFYASAASAAVFGLQFASLRLISLAAALGSFAIIFLFVKRETKSNFAGLVGAGLLAAAYRLSGDWFDVARVDSLFLFLLLASLYAARFWASCRAQALAGLLAALSFFAKQTAVLAVIPMVAASAVWGCFLRS